MLVQDIHYKMEYKNQYNMSPKEFQKFLDRVGLLLDTNMCESKSIELAIQELTEGRNYEKAKS